MRIPRLVLAVTCCAFTVGCSGQSAERPAAASVAPPAAVPSPATKPVKRVATSETSSSLDFTATEGPLDVNSINPVKMDRNAASGSGFNPFAK